MHFPTGFFPKSPRSARLCNNPCAGPKWLARRWRDLGSLPTTPCLSDQVPNNERNVSRRIFIRTKNESSRQVFRAEGYLVRDVIEPAELGALTKKMPQQPREIYRATSIRFIVRLSIVTYAQCNQAK
jgi:hypothetical protein